jgi:excisionase family DNA binding protein
MTNLNSDKLLTIGEVSGALQLTPQTIRNYIKRGTIRAKKYGQTYLIKESDLRAYLNKLTEVEKTALLP